MKKFSAFVLAMLGATVLRAEAVIDQVIVRQQWPWSTDIKVEYRISGAESPVSLGVDAWNGGVPLDSAKLHEAISGTLYGITGDVVGEFTIDPVKAFGDSGYVALANFKVRLTVAEDPRADEVLYKIYDLTATSGTFPCTDVTRADLLNGKYGTVETNFGNIGPDFATSLSDVVIWTGVTNDVVYKTTKLVMRKIPKGTFQMGSKSGENAYASNNAKLIHQVELSKDYYIGIYPLTQQQYKLLSRNQSWTPPDPKKPIGSPWTYNAYQTVVTNAIAANLAVPVNFPTEAQWEYACRAGTTSELYTGQALSSANLNPIAWHSGNSDSNTHEVGLKLPNAFGLYDMIGNSYEACRDKFSASAIGYVDGSSVVDPEEPGPQSGENYVIRGGAYTTSNFYSTSPGRNASSGNDKSFSFRLAFTVTD